MERQSDQCGAAFADNRIAILDLDSGIPRRRREKMEDMIRGKSDSSFHRSRPAHPDFSGLTPEVGICGIDLRAQVVSWVKFSPSDISGRRKPRLAFFLRSGAKLPHQVRCDEHGSREILARTDRPAHWSVTHAEPALQEKENRRKGESNLETPHDVK
jgi:hypothetical protein